MPELQAVMDVLSNFGVIGVLLVSLRYVETLRVQERDRADRYERRILRILAGDFIDKIEPVSEDDN